MRDSTNMIVRRALLLAAFAILNPVLSQAACVQDDLAGVWFLNGTVGNLRTGATTEISACKVKFSSSGGVLGGSSSCHSRSAFSNYEINIKSGTVTLNGACELKGSLNYCTNGFCSSIVLEGARLDANKSTIAFTGYAAYSPDIIFDWTGVKK